ncbi:MAG: helix-turn-helix domain-containing protein [Opitutaceae bacterium]|nr:helix-turn-helix domain-containing protein [Opitutaceae bacterium]
MGLPVAEGWLTALERGCGMPVRAFPLGHAEVTTGVGYVCRLLEAGQGPQPGCAQTHLGVREAARACGGIHRNRCSLGFWLVALPVHAGEPTPWGLIECGPLVDARQTEADFAGRLVRLGLGQPEFLAALEAWRELPRRSTEGLDGVLDLLRHVAVVIGEEVRQRQLRAIPREPAAVAAAKRHVATHLAAPLSLARVAATVGLSADHFSRVFKRTTGVGFGSYVNACRIAHARELLASKAQRVIEVAYACGFESVSHFNRVFRQEVGTAPTEYRRTIQTRA